MRTTKMIGMIGFAVALIIVQLAFGWEPTAGKWALYYDSAKTGEQVEVRIYPNFDACNEMRVRSNSVESIASGVRFECYWAEESHETQQERVFRGIPRIPRPPLTNK